MLQYSSLRYDGQNGRNYWLDDIYLAVILMLLTDMGSSKLVAARIHNLKSIIYTFYQSSIGSIL